MNISLFLQERTQAEVKVKSLTAELVKNHSKLVDEQKDRSDLKKTFRDANGVVIHLKRTIEHAKFQDLAEAEDFK